MTNARYPFARLHRVSALNRAAADQWVRDNVPGCKRAGSTFAIPLSTLSTAPATHYACSWMAMTGPQRDAMDLCPHLAAAGVDATQVDFDTFLSNAGLTRVVPEI